MKKKVLIAWSGGLDSTALIYQYLQDGYSVDAISWLDDIKNTWKSFGAFSTKKVPELSFPFIKKRKSCLIDILPETVFKHTVFCENPIFITDWDEVKLCKYDIPLIFNIVNNLKKKLVDCGECGACKRRKWEYFPKLLEI